MNKKINYFLILSIFTYNFSLQAEDEKTYPILGLATFCTSIVCTKMAQAYNKSNDIEKIEIKSPTLTHYEPQINASQSSSLAQEKNNIIHAHPKHFAQDDIQLLPSQETQPTHQKIHAKTTDDIGTEKLRNKIEPLDEALLEKIKKTAKKQLNIPRYPATDDMPLLPSQRKKIIQETIYRAKTTDDIDPKKLNQSIETSEKAHMKALLLTYTPQWHTNQQILKRLKKAKTQRIRALKEIDQLYTTNNFEEILKKTSLHISCFDNLIREEKKATASPKNQFKNGTTSTKHTFCPKESIPKKIIILKTVHGTWGNPGSYGENSEKPLSQSFLAYAQRLALEKNAIVYLDVIKWDGKLNKESRQIAGKALAQELASQLKEIKQSNPEMEISIQTIGHSHGCNVINFAAKELEPQEIIINQAIFFGSPISDIESENIDKILNIFGKLDFTGSMGSWLSTWGTSSEIRKDGHHVKNVTLQYDGQDLNHTSIKYIAMAYLPLIQKYLDENFQKERHLILDIYDQKNSSEETKETCFDDNDFSDVTQAEAESAIPHYKIDGFIDELGSEKAFDLDENLEDEDFHKSEYNRQEYKKRYGTTGLIYQQPDLLEKFICEGESAGIPSWILSTLQQTQKTSTSTAHYLDSWKVWFYNCVLKKSPVDNSEFNIDQIITETIEKIETEERFKEKSLLIAQAYGQAISQANDCGEDIELIQKKLNETFQSMNTEIGNWQYKYEWIIGKTRTADNSAWTPDEKKFLDQAKEIYKRLSTNQGEAWQDILSGYENIDNETQQALVSAIEQGLKYSEIEDQITEYMKKTTGSPQAFGQSSPKQPY